MKNLVSIVAEEITKEVDPAKVSRYMERGVEELNKFVDDLNFDIEGLLDTVGKEIRGVSLKEDGDGVLTLNIKYAISDPNKSEKIISRFEKLDMSKKFSNYVSWKALPPSASSPNFILSCRVLVPSTYLSDIINGDPNNNAKKSVIELEKMGRRLLGFFS